VVAVIFSVTLVWYVYQSQRLPSGMSGVYARLNNWMHERNHELKQNIVKVKQLAVDNKTPHQEIHFEFYTALPDMKVSTLEVEKMDTKVRSVVAINAKVDAPSLSKVVAAKKTQNIASIFNADTLQHALRTEFRTATE